MIRNINTYISLSFTGIMLFSIAPAHDICYALNTHITIKISPKCYKA